MTIQTQLKALVVGKAENDSRDGNSKYYKLAICQGGEAGSVSCPVEVYNVVEPMREYVLCGTVGEYQGKMTFRVTAVLQGSPNTPPVSKEGK